MQAYFIVLQATASKATSATTGFSEIGSQTVISGDLETWLGLHIISKLSSVAGLTHYYLDLETWLGLHIILIIRI